MKYLLPLLLVLGLTSCEEKYKVEQLHGEWQCTYVRQGQTEMTDGIVKYMSFTFNTDKTYTYSAGPTDVEKGSYWIERELLFTEGDQVLKKAVKIDVLTTDSLVLDMNDKGTDMRMIFVKK